MTLPSLLDVLCKFNFKFYRKHFYKKLGRAFVNTSIYEPDLHPHNFLISLKRRLRTLQHQFHFPAVLFSVAIITWCKSVTSPRTNISVALTDSFWNSLIWLIAWLKGIAEICVCCAGNRGQSGFAFRWSRFAAILLIISNSPLFNVRCYRLAFYVDQFTFFRGLLFPADRYMPVFLWDLIWEQVFENACSRAVEIPPVV